MNLQTIKDIHGKAEYILLPVQVYDALPTRLKMNCQDLKHGLIRKRITFTLTRLIMLKTLLLWLGCRHKLNRVIFPGIWKLRNHIFPSWNMPIRFQVKPCRKLKRHCRIWGNSMSSGLDRVAFETCEHLLTRDTRNPTLLRGATKMLLKFHLSDKCGILNVFYCLIFLFFMAGVRE